MGLHVAVREVFNIFFTNIHEIAFANHYMVTCTSPLSFKQANVKESLWQSLEEDMVPSTYTVRYNWLESQPKFSPLKKYNDSHVCVVGGTVLRFHIELQFNYTNMCLSEIMLNENGYLILT